MAGMKFILPPLAFDLLVLKVLSEVLACSPFGLGRQVGLRLGGPIRLFRLLCPFDSEFHALARAILFANIGTS